LISRHASRAEEFQKSCKFRFAKRLRPRKQNRPQDPTQETGCESVAVQTCSYLPELQTPCRCLAVPTTESLDDYRTHVERMFDENSDAVVSNSSTAHAQVVIETLISRAKDTLQFFCECLKSEIYDETVIVQKLSEALKKGVKVQVLCQNSPVAKSLNRLISRKSQNNQFELRVCDPGSPGQSAPINFIVMDGKAFRFEGDRNKHTAVACANNSELASTMTAKFKELWQRASVPQLNAC